MRLSTLLHITLVLLSLQTSFTFAFIRIHQNRYHHHSSISPRRRKNGFSIAASLSSGEIGGGLNNEKLPRAAASVAIPRDSSITSSPPSPSTPNIQIHPAHISSASSTHTTDHVSDSKSHITLKQKVEKKSAAIGKRESLVADAVTSVLLEELPEMNVDIALTRIPKLFLQDPVSVRNRLQFLKSVLVGGVSISSIILEVPRLVTYYGKEAKDMEKAIDSRYQSLIKVMKSPQHASELVNQYPRILLKDFPSRVQPYLALFTATWPEEGASYLLRKQPELFSYGIDRHLRPRIQTLPSLFPSTAAAAAAAAREYHDVGGHITVESLASVVRNYPGILIRPLQEIKGRLEALNVLLPPDLLLPTLAHHPRAWTADLSEEVGPQIRFLQQRLGADITRAILLNLPSVMYHGLQALEKKIDCLEELLGSQDGAYAVIAANPMILAVDATANIAPKIRYVQSLFPEMDPAHFVQMLSSETSSKSLTASFGPLGRLSYLLQVQPDLDLETGMKLVVASSEELRRWYPGYENFLEDRIEPRFPSYTWEQLCALPFAVREQAHGEMLHHYFSSTSSSEESVLSEQEEQEEGGSEEER